MLVNMVNVDTETACDLFNQLRSKGKFPSRQPSGGFEAFASTLHSQQDHFHFLTDHRTIERKEVALAGLLTTNGILPGIAGIGRRTVRSTDQTIAHADRGVTPFLAMPPLHRHTQIGARRNFIHGDLC